MKRKRKILTGLAFTLLFLISMSFCALAGNEEKYISSMGWMRKGMRSLHRQQLSWILEKATV